MIVAAEESTAWPGVSRPTYLGGLGFGFKWNMGWMHDTLAYFRRDPAYRFHHHGELTFSLMYAFSENFILPLSHDEVVHGKGSLLDKMPGDRWQQLANLRALYGYMWAHPGKKLLFMGGELAQEREWSHERSLDWHLLERPEHRGVQSLVGDLNRVYRDEPALWELDGEPAGFAWLELNDAAANVIAFARFSDAARARARVRLQLLARCRARATASACRAPGRWREVLNTRRDRLRRLGRRQRRRDRRRGDGLARPAVVGRAAAAAARRDLADARGSLDSARLAIDEAPNCGLAGPAVPARRDLGRERHELLGLLRERGARRALPVRRRRPRAALRADAAHGLQLARLPAGRRARASATACASTAPTRPSTGTASTPPSCCSIPTPRRSTAACAGRPRTRSRTVPGGAGGASRARRAPTTPPRCRAAS